MKIKAFKTFSLFLVLFLFFLGGCTRSKRSKSVSTRSTPPAPAATQSVNSEEAYNLGLASFNAEKYSEALTYFRNISKHSPFYAQALKIAHKIPFKRATLAYNEQRFEEAIQDLEQIKKGREDFDAAQEMIRKSNYYLRIKSYESASGEKRLQILGYLIKEALDLKRSDMLLQNIDSIGTELKKITTPEQAKILLGYLQSAATLQDKAVLEAALRHALDSFNSLNSRYPELRTDLFQLLRQLKLGLS